MKSRRDSASATRATAVSGVRDRREERALPSVPASSGRRRNRPRRASRATAAAPQSEGPGGSERPGSSRRRCGEDGRVHDVVAPEVEHASEAGLLELQARELAVAAVQDRVEQEEQRPGGLHRRRARERKNAAPASPMATETRVIALGVTARRRRGRG